MINLTIYISGNRVNIITVCYPVDFPFFQKMQGNNYIEENGASRIDATSKDNCKPSSRWVFLRENLSKVIEYGIQEGIIEKTEVNR